MTERAWRPSEAYTEAKPREPDETPVVEVTANTETFIDTFGMQFDRHFQLTQGIESWLEANPDFDCFTYLPDETDGSYTRQQGSFKVTRDTVQTVRKHVGLTRYMYLVEHSAFGRELADDIQKSWEKPEEEDEGR